MVEKITYTNERGGILIFEERLPPYILLDKKGFSGIENKISSEKLYGLDGEYAYDASLSVRSLSLSVLVNGETSVEDNDLRKNLMRVLNPKLSGKITYERFNSIYEIDVNISHSWEDAYDTGSHTLQGSVEFVALSPFWRDVSSDSYTVQLGKTNNLFCFPLAITDDFKFAEVDSGQEVKVSNPGDVSVGLEFEIFCTAGVVNPRILNIYSREYFGFEYTFSSGDKIYINTNRGKKQVLINGENGYSKRSLDSTFLQLDNLQDNYFILQADSGVENMSGRMKFFPLLSGV